MLLQPPVQLTKIHFYNNQQIATISDIFDQQINNNVQKALFRNKWVLKISEIKEGGEKLQWRLVGSVLIVSCLIVAGIAGVYFSKATRILYKTAVERNDVTVLNLTRQSDVCQNCTGICLKLGETERPQCVQPVDKKDPTGCGGFCKVNTQFCQLLDARRKVHQCLNVKALKCPQKSFNCGNMCISMEKKCDGVVHCSNKSDEIDCDCNLVTHFRCGNVTSCLSNEKKCDGFVDCWDKSDEMQCPGCQYGEIPCLNGECIPKEQFCDGEHNCRDESDEPQGCQLQ